MRVHNRFGGTAGSAFLTGGIRDMRFLACGIRDSQGQAGSGSENLALRDTGFSILRSGIRDLNRVLIKHTQKGLSLLSLLCVIWTCMRSKHFSLESTSYKKQIKLLHDAMHRRDLRSFSHD